MDDLIAELERAEKGSQPELLHRAVDFARDQGWFNEDEHAKAWAFINIGAFESAALTLVPEGRYWRINPSLSKGRPTAGVECDTCEAMAEAATPALALTIAALKARKETPAEAGELPGSHD